MPEMFEKLHPLEVKVLSVLFDGISLKGITSQSSLQEVEAMRALQWLENKKLVTIKTYVKEAVHLGKNGSIYLEKGFPEKIFLKSLTTPKILPEIKQQTKLTDEEINISLGILKKLDAIKISNKISITETGKTLLKKELPQEIFLKKLPINTKNISDKKTYEELKKRKNLIKTEIIKEKIINITSQGKLLLEKAKSQKTTNTIGSLTPEIIKKQKWKNRKFRPYDIKINVPKIIAGKLHPYNQFLRQVRKKLLEMGFEEMQGPVIETEFFNFDALFQPQNHPARDWSDTYKIKEPKYGSLPNKKIINAVKSAHENGAKTKSTGWKYKWSETIAKQLMPRAQGTALSARYLINKARIPGKYFSIARCYRPDVIDSTHAVEFNQLEGFVIGKKINFTHLLGLLKEFAQKITNSNQIRFKPDYYPFTEPSVELSIKHPKLGWIEIGGAGIFRSEVTEPLGYKEQVIAWGMGIDRLAMLKMKIKDIRELFTQNIEYLRKCQI